MTTADAGGATRGDSGSPEVQQQQGQLPRKEKSALNVVFRFRVLLHVVIYGLGLWAPWDYALHLDANGISTWLMVAAWPARSGWLGFTASTVTVLTLGILFTLLGALLRTWGTAYLSTGVVFDGSLQAQRLLADGPYRRMRNPLYAGTVLHTLGLVLLMPPSGAVFSLGGIVALQMALVAAEEQFLLTTRGSEYAAYKQMVPGWVPSLSANVTASGARPQWLQAFLGESYMWGVFVSFAVLGWRYNSLLVLRGVIVSLGVSLVARAFVRGEPTRRGAC